MNDPRTLYRIRTMNEPLPSSKALKPPINAFRVRRTVASLLAIAGIFAMRSTVCDRM
jgi:hypothetical protein